MCAVGLTTYVISLFYNILLSVILCSGETSLRDPSKCLSLSIDASI